MWRTLCCAPPAPLRKVPALPDQPPPVRWQPDRTPALPPWPAPPLFTAMGRGIMGRCPACGQTHLFKGYLKVVPQCWYVAQYIQQHPEFADLLEQR